METREKKPILVRLAPKQYERLKREADRELRSINNTIALAISDFLNKRESSKEAPHDNK